MLEDRLRAIPFFRAVPAADLAALAATLEHEVHPAGATIFREGDAADALYLVDAGRVEVRRNGEPLAVLDAGSFVGELGLLLGEARSADLVALTEVSLSALTRTALDGLLESHPILGIELSRELGRRLIATNRRIGAPPARRVIAHWGSGRDLDRLVGEVRDLAWTSWSSARTRRCPSGRPPRW